MIDEIFRQLIIADGVKYGRVGLARVDGEDVLRITRYEPGTVCSLDFPFVAVPRLIALLTHAWNTKTRERDNETYVFPRLEED